MSQTRNDSLADEVLARIVEVLPAEARGDHRISVCVRGSEATLTGEAPSWAASKEAERVARDVPGITHVDNQLALLVKGNVEPPETWTSAHHTRGSSSD